jgi:hypothetical protein
MLRENIGASTLTMSIYRGKSFLSSESLTAQEFKVSTLLLYFYAFFMPKNNKEIKQNTTLNPLYWERPPCKAGFLSCRVFRHRVYFYKEPIMGDETLIREPQRGLSFEDVWAAIMELRENSKETALQMKQTDRKLGELGNRFGELAEHLVAPSIHEKFNALGYHFDAVSPGGTEIKDPGGETYAEIDILLQNTEYLVAVEIKSKLREEDVDAHVRRLEILRRWADKHRDDRKIRGAAAGAIVSREVRQYALKAGLYVIVQTGDTVKIDIPEGFIPREW